MTERQLAPHEAAITAAGVRLVLHCDIVGELDEAVLALALARLRSCYPLITGRITTDRAEAGPLARIGETATGPFLGHGADFDEEISAPSTGNRIRCSGSPCSTSRTAPVTAGWS